MKTTKQKEELKSRREFFKTAAKGVLPILGLTILGPTILTSCDKLDDIIGCSDCAGGCEKDCTSGCNTGCKGSCKSGCVGSCSTTCSTTCKGGCKTSCNTTCKNACTKSCSTTCKGLCKRAGKY